MRKTSFVIAATLLTAGCYTYTPLDNSPRPGGLLRVNLTDEGTSRLTSQLGPRVGAIDGRLLQAVSATEPLLLSVAVTTARDGVEQDWKGERVTVPRELVASLRERKLSRARSFLAGGGLIALVAGAIATFGGGESGGEGSGGQPPVGQ